MNTQHKQKAKQYIILWIVLLAMLPGILAVVLYKHPSWLPFKMSNHGNLLHPAKPLAYINLFQNDVGKKMLHKWTLTYFSDNCCPKSCQSKLHQLHQLRIALGKDSTRLQLLIIENAGCQMDSTQIARDVMLLAANPIQRLQFAKALNNEDAKVGFNSASHLLLFDPHINGVMYFEDNISMQALYQDLKHLLRISQIG